MNVKSLREDRREVLDNVDRLLDSASVRGTALNSAELRQHDELLDKLAKLDRQLADAESQLESHRAEAYARTTETPSTSRALTDKERKQAFRAWASVDSPVKPSDSGMELAKRAGFAAEKGLTFDLGERRAMGSYVSTKGPEAISEGFAPRIEKALLNYGSVRNVSRMVTTGSGNPLKFPISNDTANTGRLLTENTQVTATDVVISELGIDAYKFSSDLVLVSAELLQDEEVDIERVLGELLGERLGRITNAYATTGTGTNEPKGCVTASALHTTLAGDDAITYAELVNFQHSVDPAYQDNARWMFNFSTLAKLKTMVDGAGRPLWMESSTAGFGGDFPGTILGKPYTINQQMPSMTADAKAIVYGDFDQFLWREVKGIQLMRLNERYADYHQVAFLAFMRMDCDLLNAGTNPLKCVRMAGS